MSRGPAGWRERAALMLDDGASYTEVAASVGVHRCTVAKWFPGRGWSQVQGGEFGYMMKQKGSVL